MKLEPFLLFSLFLYLACSVIRASDSLLSPKGVNYEVAALMSLKNKMVDSLQVLSGWDINSVDPCTWNMVACSAEGYVISLEMVSVRLAGTLSPSIGNLSHLRTLLLQNNQLSGPVPPEIGKLSELQTLDLSGNQFDGEIPSSLGSLSQLSYLRLSRNRLSGQIPNTIANLTGLFFLDLSYNNLSGPTPTILAKGYSILGNTYLCDSQPCSTTMEPAPGTNKPRNHSGRNHWILSLATGISCTFVVSVMLVVCWVHWYKSRLLFMSYEEQDYEFEIDHVKRFTVRELQMATGNFSQKNILGQGGFGVVYKGRLANGTMIAVKRLKDPNYTGEVQFQTEVEMIGLALHRNLLQLYGFCMTPEERLLVYPYMPNGSVADCLRDTSRGRPSLDWRRRMILDWVRKLKEENRLEMLVDASLEGSFDDTELEKAVELALHCTQPYPSLRPKMSEVLKVLEGLGQSGSDHGIEPSRAFSFSREYPSGDILVHEESSFIVEAMELSGPR
ncbi:hypothetical protein MLD38_010090 [Melastoma candidum]|uniref:Uncharacterized protein n=1 Tax=Melastoma candidum TaxID=119954 RepID=A0ACB9R1U0_9MYRT|nr:hypothetical protein MLD38_010090 [Melastoma candidum]